MPDLVYNRLVTLSRAIHSSNPTKGSRMTEDVYATDLAASVQPKRDRNVTPQNYPTAVGTTSADSMTTWKIILPGFTGVIRKNDVATDDLGNKYIIEIYFPNPFGAYVEARITQP